MLTAKRLRAPPESGIRLLGFDTGGAGGAGRL